MEQLFFFRLPLIFTGRKLRPLGIGVQDPGNIIIITAVEDVDKQEVGMIQADMAVATHSTVNDFAQSSREKTRHELCSARG
jgi:hypothetical protein